jgi:hypothetical protein
MGFIWTDLTICRQTALLVADSSECMHTCMAMHPQVTGQKAREEQRVQGRTNNLLSLHYIWSI